MIPSGGGGGVSEEPGRSQWGGANGAEPTTYGRGVSESDEILPANDRRPLQKSNQIIFFLKKIRNRRRKRNKTKQNKTKKFKKK